PSLARQPASFPGQPANPAIPIAPPEPHMRRSSITAAIALCLAFPPLTVVAQDESDAADARRLDQIQVTGTRREESVLEVPMGITVVDAEEIRRMAPQTVSDLLHGE